MLEGFVLFILTVAAIALLQ